MLKIYGSIKPTNIKFNSVSLLNRDVDTLITSKYKYSLPDVSLDLVDSHTWCKYFRIFKNDDINSQYAIGKILVKINDSYDRIVRIEFFVETI